MWYVEKCWRMLSINKQNKIYKPMFFIAHQNSYHPLQHTFDNIHTETISKGLLWNQSQNGCHMIFDNIYVCKTFTFHGCLQVGKQEGFCRNQVRVVWRMLKNNYHLLCQELVQMDQAVSRDIHFPVLCNSGQTCQICCNNRFKMDWKKCNINGSICSNKVLVDDDVGVKEGNQQSFLLGFFRLLVFSHGEDGEYQKVIAILILDWTGSTRSHLPWWCHSEAMNPGDT